MKNKVFSVALTGGIGCGKSFVLQVFADCGAVVASADSIARKLRELPDVADGIAGILGDEVRNAAGGVDTVKVADVIFCNEEAREKLEEYLHPLIRNAIKDFINSTAVLQGENKIAVIEVPLLFESGWMDDFDKTVAVWSADACIPDRISSRNWNMEEYSRRAALQLTAADKLAKADYGIINNGSARSVEKQCAELIKMWKAMEDSGND